MFVGRLRSEFIGLSKHSSIQWEKRIMKKMIPFFNVSGIYAHLSSEKTEKTLRRTVFDYLSCFCKQLNFPCISYGNFEQMPRKWHFHPCHECISWKKLCHTESCNPMNFSACIDFTRSKNYKIMVWFESYRLSFFQALKPRKWHQKCIFFEADFGTSLKSELAIPRG